MFNTAFLSVLSATKFMQGLGKENKIMFSKFWAKSNQFNSPSNAIFVSLAPRRLFLPPWPGIFERGKSPLSNSK